jgi:hypothetical protein
MSERHDSGSGQTIPAPANDNESRPRKLTAVVLIPADSPITQVEIEVFSALLDDWASLAANDNEEQPK